MTERTGSHTLNITTALTRAVTLSRVMTSCGGMVRVTTRWSTRTDRSRNGSMSTRPGPSAPRSRPRRKTTSRSYSRTTFSEATSSASRTPATTRAATTELGILLRLLPVRGVPGASEHDRHRVRVRVGTTVGGVGGPPATDRLDRLRAFLEVLVQGPEEHPLGVHRAVAQVRPQRCAPERDEQAGAQEEDLAR